MGLIRVELMTPSLSEKCSNQLSYRPYKKRGRGKEQALGKRVNRASCVLQDLPYIED